MKYPYYIIKFINKNNKMVYKFRSTHKLRVRSKLSLLRFKDCMIYFKVQYSPEFYTEGKYKSKKEAIYAWKCATENDLIKGFI